MTGVIGIIQARLSSSRLPGKVLAPIGGHPLLAVLVERLRTARVGEWWLATSRDARDDLTAAWGEELGLRVHRGHLEDVLSRFTAIIRERRPEWITRVTADDPFIDGAVVNAVLDGLADAEKEAALVGIGGEAPVFPLGYGAELARTAALLSSESEIPDDQPWHRSHVLSWVRDHAPTHLVPAPPEWPRRPAWRWTVDTPADIEMTRAAFALFGDRWPSIGYAEMVEILDAHPEVTAINGDVRQKELAEG